MRTLKSNLKSNFELLVLNFELEECAQKAI